MISRLGVLLLLVTPAVAADNWVRVNTANGATYAINLSTVGYFPSGGIYAVVCEVDHDRCNVMDRRTLLFDCDGHYISLAPYAPARLIAPPNSVIGRVADLVCEHAKTLPKGYQPDYK